jgi:hypothetical protein
LIRSPDDRLRCQLMSPAASCLRAAFEEAAAFPALTNAGMPVPGSRRTLGARAVTTAWSHSPSARSSAGGFGFRCEGSASHVRRRRMPYLVGSCEAFVCTLIGNLQRFAQAGPMSVIRTRRAPTPCVGFESCRPPAHDASPLGGRRLVRRLALAWSPALQPALENVGMNR